MPTENYKIEIKPTWWVILEERGCYSDKDTNHLVFRANSKEEAKKFYLEVKKSEIAVNEKEGFDEEYDYCEESYRFVFESKNKEKKVNLINPKNLDFDTWDYSTVRVSINPLKVYHVNKINITK